MTEYIYLLWFICTMQRHASTERNEVVMRVYSADETQKHDAR